MRGVTFARLTPLAAWGCLAGAVALTPACEDELAAPPTTTGDQPTCSPGETRACYDGPPETENVGACRSGVQACLQLGGWGECAGQQTPEQENCDAPEDENCDGLTSCGQTVWARRLGVDSDEVVYNIGSDDAGAVYLLGFYRTALDLGGGELGAPSASRELLIAKYDADGEHVWSHGIYGASNLEPQNIAVAPNGDAVVIVATVREAIIVDGVIIEPNGGADALVAKIDGDGSIAWARRLGDDDEQVATAAAIDDDGSIVVTGYFQGEIDAGGNAPLTTMGTNRDAFVMRLNPDGSPKWGRSYPGPLDQIPRDVGITPAGRIVVTGRISGSVDFGGGEHQASGDSRDIFMLALEEGGTYAFSHVWGGDGNDEAWALAVDTEGNTILTGRYESGFRVGPDELNAAGGAAIPVIKVGPDGAVAWARSIGGASELWSMDVVTDGRDRIVLSGYYIGTVSFGEATLPQSGLEEPNILIAKLEPSGDPVWARGIVVEGNQDVAGVPRGWRSVAMLPGDFIALGGFVQRAIDLGTGPLDDLGGADLLLATLAP